MPRNGSGSYSLPEPPFVPLTTISSAAMNSDLSDIGQALTASLARDGQGGMTDVLPMNTAGFTYTNDLNTGMYRTGADAQAIKCGGSDIVSVTTSGANVTGDLSATTIKQNGLALIPVGLGPIPWSGTVAPSGWLLWYGRTLSRTTYAALWSYAQSEIALGNLLFGSGDGSTTFTLTDIRGMGLIANTAMGGTSPSSNLTSTYYGANPAVLGTPGGSQSKSIGLTHLPATPAPVSVSGTPTVQGGQSALGLPNGAIGSGVGGAGGGSVLRAADFQGFDSLTLTNNSANLGSGTPLSAVQPGIIVNYIIYAGV